MIFILLCLIHILFWLFVMFAFLNTRTAKINVYIVIPLVYILHMLPFHILSKLKQEIKKEHAANEENKFYKLLCFPYAFIELQIKFKKYCTFSPISPQGLLIFGLITSIFRLYPPNYKNILNKN